MKDKDVATERFFHGIRINILCWPQRPCRSCYKVYLAALTHTSLWQKVRIVTWLAPTVALVLHVLFILGLSKSDLDTQLDFYMPHKSERH